MTDPIADFLTRIRNAVKANHKVVEAPGSKIKQEITKILYEQGYILAYKFDTNEQGHPTIKIALDVHRDAIQRDDGTRVKPVADIGGMKAAQVMIICGADVDGNLPNFKQNLRFASRWQDKMESMFPGLTRPVLFDYRYYNQDLTTGSLLIEMGGHANTLEEAKYSGRLVGQALAALFAEG